MLSKTRGKRRVEHFWELKQYPKVSAISHTIKNKAGPYLGQNGLFSRSVEYVNKL